MTTCDVQPFSADDRRAVAALLDDAVGAGFHDVTGADARLSFIARETGHETVVGAVLADRADQGAVLHIRQLAVAPAWRRRGVARRLLAEAEAAGAAAGAASAVVYAWLPHGLPEPPSVPTYLAAGYRAARDIPDFYAAWSVANAAECPYCGAPPCRCAVRELVKDLGPVPAG